MTEHKIVTIRRIPVQYRMERTDYTIDELLKDFGDDEDDSLVAPLCRLIKRLDAQLEAADDLARTVHEGFIAPMLESLTIDPDMDLTYDDLDSEYKFLDEAWKKYRALREAKE